MGLLDDLKHKAEQLGDKAREGMDSARDRAGDLVGGAKERFAQHDAEDEDDADTAPIGESSDVGPDSSSADAVQPGYVTDEDVLDAGVVSEGNTDAEEASNDGADGIDPVATTETDAPDPVDPADDTGETLQPTVAAEPTDEPTATTDAATDVVAEPAIETNVDPYDQPLTESIGDALGGLDPKALAEVVEGSSTDQDS